MQMVQEGDHPGKASVVFLPMLNLDPTDMSCVYSTVIFLVDQAITNSTTPVITFDQQLWWKSQIIVMNEENESHLKSIVLRLGGFHTEMSYLGTIGHLMQNTGLNEAFEIVYGGNTVRQMICGKAVARAHRDHFLLDAALNILILLDALQPPLPMSLNDSSTISNDTDTSFDPKDLSTGNVKLETETDVTQEEHSDSTSTLNSDSEIITIIRQVVLRQ